MNNPFHELVLTMPLTEEVFDKVNTAANRSALRSSTTLSKRQWLLLWEKNLPVHEACQLLEYDLDAEQLETVLTTERRSSPLLCLLRRQVLDKDTQLRITQLAKGDSFATHALQTGRLHEEVIPVMADRLKGVDRLEWIACNHATHDDDAVYDAVVEATDKKLPLRDMRSLNQSIGKIISLRPGLVSRLVSMDPLPAQLRTPLASSRFLTEEADQVKVFADPEDSKFAALAFVANPVACESVVSTLASHEASEVRQAVAKRLNNGFKRVSLPYEQISDPDEVAWVLRRSLPSAFRLEGRPADLAALALNDNLSLEDANTVFEALSRSSLDMVTAAQLNAARAHLAKRLERLEPETVEESGFWNRPVLSSHYPQLRYDWVLSPTVRPWSDIDVASLVDSYPTTLSQLENYSLAQSSYGDRVGLHLWLVHRIGLEPAQWELLLNLSKSHLGSLGKLIMAVKRLSSQ